MSTVRIILTVILVIILIPLLIATIPALFVLSLIVEINNIEHPSQDILPNEESKEDIV
jgi:hypothetical protein